MSLSRCSETEAVAPGTLVTPRFVVMLIVFSLALTQPARGQETCANPVALFESVRNAVQVVPATNRPTAPAARQQRVCAGDTIRVGDNSRAVVLILSSNTPIALDQNTEFRIPAQTGTARTLINLLRGALLYISRVPHDVEIQTPFVNASIEGT